MSSDRPVIIKIGVRGGFFPRLLRFKVSAITGSCCTTSLNVMPVFVNTFDFINPYFPTESITQLVATVCKYRRPASDTCRFTAARNWASRAENPLMAIPSTPLIDDPSTVVNTSNKSAGGAPA